MRKTLDGYDDFTYEFDRNACDLTVFGDGKKVVIKIGTFDGFGLAIHEIDNSTVMPLQFIYDVVEVYNKEDSDNK